MQKAFSKGGHAATIALAALFLLPVTVAAAPLPTLAGEQFVADFDWSLNGTCNPVGPSTFNFSGVPGKATGPNPGRFSEMGTFTMGSPSGPLTSLSLSFTITATGQQNVIGTKGLVSSTAGCTPGGVFSGAHFIAVTSYSVTAPFVETGTAPMVLDFRFGGAFTEGPFAVAPPPGQAGCDTNGQSNGNDECTQ